MTLQSKNNHRTEDQRLLIAPCDQPENFTDTDPWRVMRVMSEFVQGFDALADLGPAITIFGSARVKPDHIHYQQAVATARLLGEADHIFHDEDVAPVILERARADAVRHIVAPQIPVPDGLYLYLSLAKDDKL